MATRDFKSYQPEAQQIKQTEFIINDIAQLAWSAHCLLSEILDKDGGELEQVWNLSAATRALIAQVGWLADRACREISGKQALQMLGNADRWLLSVAHNQSISEDEL